MGVPSLSHVEALMDQVVENIGGQRVEDVYRPGEGEKNADYVFVPDQVVMELKCLERDQFGDFAKNLNSLLSEWIESGLFPPLSPGKNQYNTSSLPEQEQLRAFKQLLDRVNSTVKKANKQIKQTKESLGMPEARGVLVLANVANTALEPSILLFILARVFFQDKKGKRRYNGIDRLIYFTHDMDSAPEAAGKTQIWLSPLLGHSSSSSDPFIERLRDAWFNQLEQRTQTHISVRSGYPKELQHIRYRTQTHLSNDITVKVASNLHIEASKTEQHIIDSLEHIIRQLQTTGHQQAELCRMIIKSEDGWNPQTIFPTLQHFCRQFGAHTIIATYSLNNWPGDEIVSVNISLSAQYHHDDPARTLRNTMMPLTTEASLVELLPSAFAQLENKAEVELCRLEMMTTEDFSLESYLPLVWHLCGQHKIVLLATESPKGADTSLSINMRRLLI